MRHAALSSEDTTTMSGKRLLRRGLSVDRDIQCDCPFLSRFANLFAPSSDNSFIPTLDLFTEYKTKVAAWTEDKQLQALAGRRQAFTTQFRAVAINVGFAYVESPRRGYKVRRVRVGRNLGGGEGDRDVLGEPLRYSLRGYSSRSAVQERERRGDVFSAPIIAPVDAKTGKGVFATRNYREGEEVCECFGQLIPRADVDGRLGEYDRLNLTYRFIHIQGAHGHEELVLDGHRNHQGDLIHPDSNLGATMNHSRDNANCKLTRVTGRRGERPRFLVVAKTGISAGAELRLEYGDFRRGVESFIDHREFSQR